MSAYLERLVDLEDGLAEEARIKAEARSVRRYEIAKAVLAGFAALPETEFASSFDGEIDIAANSAVRWADALLAELEK